MYASLLYDIRYHLKMYKINLLHSVIVTAISEQRFITKEHIATHNHNSPALTLQYLIISTGLEIRSVSL